MIENMQPIDKLHSLAQAKKRSYVTKTVHPKLVEDYLADGWLVESKLKTAVRIRKDKSHGPKLEDKVWHLFYRMRFAELSGDGGATVTISQKQESGLRTQLDVAAIDDEVALAIECKSSEKPAKRPQFQEELGKHALLRQAFANAVSSQYGGARKAVLAMFLSNVLLSENDKNRAKEANVALFDTKDIDYYETLVDQVGPAAKYQFLSDLLEGREVPGLKIRVPAVQTRLGGVRVFNFCISPEYLLKISFVSHRAKGKASDVDTYQRMLSKSKLKQIKDYISDDGIFPTNIVVNLDKECVRFERTKQETTESSDAESGTLGWLDLKPTYKSAWIIDGQHRLFAYSGHEKAKASLLPVLAFEGLVPSRQAELFIDINGKQKRVKQSLLQELYAELNWDAEEPRKRVGAIISKAIQDLDMDPTSPFYQRIQTADDDKDQLNCISITSMFGAIEKTGFHIMGEKHGHVVEYGPLWAGEGKATLRRTESVLKDWFNMIRDGAQDWWDKGSGLGGGLAMNDGVIACINVLRSVFMALDSSGQHLLKLDDEDLVESVRKYGMALGKYFGSLSEAERSQFRSLRGIQGQTTRTRHCQQAIRVAMPDFNPPGLDEFLELEKAQTTEKAKAVVGQIEKILQGFIMEQLRREYGSDESQWWVMGVPKSVRLNVTQKYEQDDGKRGGKEYYFDILDYKKIATENWQLFEPILAKGKGNKDARTSWLDFTNEKRNLALHASSGVSISLEVLSQLEEHQHWLASRISGTGEPGGQAGQR